MRVAAVDIGTNTVRLLLGEVAGGGLLSIAEKRTEITRLGRGVDERRRLDPRAVQLTVDVLGEYGSAADRFAAERRGAVATSATRDAEDREAFLDLAATAFGARPDVIAGEREAELAFAGVRSAVRPAGPILVVDLGGGSTEFVFGEDDVEYARSVDVGSVRVTERWLARRPITTEALAAARSAVAGALAPLEIPGAPGLVIGVAGTFTTLAAVHLELAVYDRDVVHGSVLRLDDLMRMVERLAALSVEDIAAIPTVPPGRADVLLGGAIVAEAAVARSGHGEVTISEADLLDGIALAIGTD
ncbi:MAG TPA: Ppx/GppA phosphatase family protein [Acidimicrobiia bacterium]